MSYSKYSVAKHKKINKINVIPCDIIVYVISFWDLRNILFIFLKMQALI